MKILSPDQIKAADKFTIENEPVASIELMERAAQACTDVIVKMLRRGQRTMVFCGTGNNGGDGLAIARQLAEKEHAVEVFVVRISDGSDDFNTNLERLQAVQIEVNEIQNKADIPEIPADALVVDAIFGIGLSRPVEGIADEVIAAINDSKAAVVSIDMPSGLFSEDNSENDRRSIVRANHTLTFEVPKLALLFAGNSNFVGHWQCLSIGLAPRFLQMLPVDYQMLTIENVRPMIKKRSKHSHKGTYGHALLMAGSFGKMGAATLAARACLHAGVGLLTVHVPKCGYEILQIGVPEAMCKADEHFEFLTAHYAEGHQALGVGPGIGTTKETAQALKFAIQNSGAPMVLDADALNILSENQTWLSFLPKGSILTPHPGEFVRLAGNIEDDYQRMQVLREKARQWQVYIVLKGAYTAVAFPDGQVFFNSTGNPGMATGGSGDVLTGIITGLVAQGYASHQAAILGVYLHGLAGDIAARKMEMEAVTAGTIIDHLGEAWRTLKRPNA